MLLSAESLVLVAEYDETERIRYVDMRPVGFSISYTVAPDHVFKTGATMTKPKDSNRRSAYQWYLISPSWHERRTAILRRAEGICERCEERPATQVHHLTYLRVFQEHPSDLMALCAKCHAELHYKKPANDNQLSFNFGVEDDN